MAKAKERCLNINVGVMGHVDCGKTSLVEKLSTTFSTASLDKHPQSQERGITLDLGFSSFRQPYPSYLDNPSGCTSLQFTLVDCPGHASLIRTVLGGSHIMDLMILVVDITKGIQVQTAECIVIGEITVNKMVVVLNKVDLIPQDKVERTIHKATKKVAQTLKLTKFGGSKILPLSAKSGEDIYLLAHELGQLVDELPERKTGSLLFAADHCFRIKGQGTIVTGTVLQGALRVQDTIEFPTLMQKRKVKSIQMFREPVGEVRAGDRAGICVSNLDPSRIERSLVASPGAVHTFEAALAKIEKVRFFDEPVKSRRRFHVIYGHSMSIASCLFLTKMIDHEYEYHEELLLSPNTTQFALIKFDTAMIAPMGLKLIGAKLDGGSDVLSCRLAFHGDIIQLLQAEALKKLKIFKIKERNGYIKLINSDQKSAICGGMFKRDVDVDYFKGKQVMSKKGYQGTVTQAHGKDGDFIVTFETLVQFQSQEEMQITFFIKKPI